MKCVILPFQKSQLRCYISKNILERNLILIRCVALLLLWNPIWWYIWEHTLERNHILVNSVFLPFHRTVLIYNISKHIDVKYSWTVSVFFLLKKDTFDKLWILAGVKPYSCEMCSSSFSQKFTLRLHEQTYWREILFLLCAWSFLFHNSQVYAENKFLWHMSWLLKSKNKYTLTLEKPYCVICTFLQLYGPTFI